MLNSLRENNEAGKREINTANITNSRETIELIRHYEEIIKTQNKRVIGYIIKQGEILKKFKESKNFFDNAVQSRSTVYFKIVLYNFFKKPRSKKSILFEVIRRITSKIISQSVKNNQTCFPDK